MVRVKPRREMRTVLCPGGRNPSRCPKMARRSRRRRLNFRHVSGRRDPHRANRHANRRRDLLPSPDRARRPIRRPVFRGSHDHEDLLPPDLPRTDAGPRPVPVFLQLRPGGERGIPAVPAMPARAGSRPCSGRFGEEDGSGGRWPDRGGCLERWGQPGEAGRRFGTRARASSAARSGRSSASRRSSWPRPSACSWPSNC